MDGNEFDVSREIEYFVRNVCGGIRSKQKREAASDEIREHFEDAIYSKTLRGMSREKAFREACEDFGDPSKVKVMLALSNNRFSPEFFKEIVLFLARAFISYSVYLLIRGLVSLSSADFVWYFYVPSFLILFGLQPLRYLGLMCSRLKFIARLKRLAKEQSGKIELLSDPFLSLFRSSDICDIVMKAKGECVCIKFLTFLKRSESLRFLDETLYSVTTLHSGGARFVNRNPHMMMNQVVTPNLGFSTAKLRAYSFCLPLELEEEGGIKKVMIVDRLPREMTYVKGSGIEYVDLGAYVFGFSVHSVKSFLKTLKGEN